MRIRTEYQRCYKQRLRDDRQAQGICVACGVEPLKTKHYCVFCVVAVNAYQKGVRDRRRAAKKAEHSAYPAWLAPLLTKSEVGA